MKTIRDYAAIGNGRSAALVSRDGSIDWLCWPRFDSPSLFAAMLDVDRGGHWRIAPRSPARTSRAYSGESNVLVTTFETENGRVRLTDLMPIGSEDDKKARLVPEHELLRIVECEAGAADVEVRYEPRLDYARRPTRLRACGALGIRLEDGARLYTLRSDAAFTVQDDGSALCVARMRSGERLHFSLTYAGDGPAVLPPLGQYAAEAVRRSVDWWSRWAGRCNYGGPYRRQVVRSLLALKLMSYAPSGAIIAAPTTSLPERIGGDLNWDYRYCWVRDASLTVRVLLDLGYQDEAEAFVGWLLHSTRLTRPELRVLYDVYGELPKREEVLAHLEGHRSSKPVRIRNGAASQLQLDAYGEVIDAVAYTVRRGARLDRETQAMLRQFGEYVSENWWRPDHGIWEPRDAPRDHTHSRLLCWVALDRLLELHAKGALAKLNATRTIDITKRIRTEIETRGWNPTLKAYTQTLDGSSVDASLLLMSWYGFADADHPKLRQTFERIQERLNVGPGLIHRYEQSRASGEGAFGICCFWAVDYLARGGGSIDEAEQHFEQLLQYANELGLYAEEIDPSSGDPLGNFPQAFTHVGLIGAALALEERRSAEAGRRDARIVQEHGERPPGLERPEKQREVEL